MTNLDNILRSRDITLPTKVHLVKAMVMYGCESWTIKKAEHRRIDAFELWCWKRLLRVPWTTKRSNQSLLKETNPEYSLEGLMLKFQYFDHLMQKLSHWKRPWCWKNWRQEEKGTTEDEMVGCHHWHNVHEFEQAPGVGDGQGILACCRPCCRPWGLIWTEFTLIYGLNIPGSYAIYSLQHQTLSPGTSTTGCCFYFGSAFSFSLESFLHPSPVAYWAPTDLGSSPFVSYIFAFSYCSYGSQDNTEEICHSFLR